jgi:hypothetical protein
MVNIVRIGAEQFPERPAAFDVSRLSRRVFPIACYSLDHTLSGLDLITSSIQRHFNNFRIKISLYHYHCFRWAPFSFAANNGYDGKPVAVNGSALVNG